MILKFNEFVNENYKSYPIVTSFDLSENELDEIAEWGLTSEYSSSAAWDDTSGNLADAITYTVEDFKEIISKDYPRGFKNIPTPIIVYRFVTAIKKEDIKTVHMGKSWFADIEHPRKEIDFFQQLTHIKYNVRNLGHTLFLISAEVGIDNIDIPRTLWQRSTINIENEIVLKNDSDLKIIDITEWKR